MIVFAMMCKSDFMIVDFVIRRIFIITRNYFFDNLSESLILERAIETQKAIR